MRRNSTIDNQARVGAGNDDAEWCVLCRILHYAQHESDGNCGCTVADRLISCVCVVRYNILYYDHIMLDNYVAGS